nr:phloem protein 2-like protein [Tanacetum cinerariifolium]
MENLKHLKIPFRKIYSATNGFDDSCMIGWGGFGGVYTAELFHVDVRKYVGKKKSRVELYGYPKRKGKVALKRREIMSDQGRKEFWKEIDVLSELNHQNIISLVGFCYEYGEMIIIYDYASNGSFDRYLRNNQNLKWEKRLQICIDAAQGLNYLHNHHIIHRDVKSGNILLGGSLDGIIGDVGLSRTIGEGDFKVLNTNPVGTHGYIDPIYLKKGILSKQSDMYSLGVVLLEVLSGRFARPSAKGKDRASLVDMAECHLSNNQPSQIIDDYLRKDLEKENFLNSVKTFAAITRECLHSTETDHSRLTMADVLKELKKALTLHLVGVETILLEEVKSATNNFNHKCVIGSGASGKVYKGELTLSKKSIPVAVKRLGRRNNFYREGGLLKEVAKVSRYVHKNIITLRGFYEDWYEKIIIMDYAINGSLDKHLHKSTLTWGLRLKISIGVAKGLNHIHSFEEGQNTVHGDVKSSKILLDHDWKATISDFIASKIHGTLGYLDPQYSSSGATKKTDVYSFGVVLFELLSGRLAVDKVENYSHPTLRQIIDEGDEVKDKKVVFLAWMAKRCFEEKKQRALIFDDIKEQTDVKSIDILSEVAYECLQKDQEKRPTMALVIPELEKALDIHVDWEFEQNLPKDNENILKMIKHRESKKTTKKDLYSIFFSGIRLNNGEVWLSLNKDGKVKEMISATTFSYESCWSSELNVLENSRFGTVAKISDTLDLKIPIKIKTQFLSLGIIYGVYLVEHEKSVDRSINADSSINWYQQSWSDFQEIMTGSQYDAATMTKQELDKLLSTGVLIDNGEKVLTDWLLYNKQLFSLSKMNNKKCHMLPAKAVINKSLNAEYSKCQPSATSRFEKVVELQRHRAFSINCNIETKMLSADTAYACYLVFQLPENSKGLMCPVKARDLLNKNNKDTTIIYLKPPGPVDLYRDKRVPDRREDGWMEVRVWEFVYDNEIKDNYIPMELKLACLGGTMSGLIISGVEFRPL